MLAHACKRILPDLKKYFTKECCGWEEDHGVQDAVDDARLPAAGLADDDGDVLILGHRLDADPPRAQVAGH